MGSAPRFTVGLGLCGLLLGATVPAAGQERRAAPVYGETPDQRPEPLVARGAVARASAPKETLRAASPAARPSEPGPSPRAIEAVSQTPAAMPPGLSKDAPDTAPSVGIGRGNANGRSRGASPAATPEPSTLLLMGAGLAGLYRLRRRR